MRYIFRCFAFRSAVTRREKSHLRFLTRNLIVTVSQGAQEIFKLLPHTFVDPSRLPELFETVIILSLFCESSLHILPSAVGQAVV